MQTIIRSLQATMVLHDRYTQRMRNYFFLLWCCPALFESGELSAQIELLPPNDRYALSLVSDKEAVVDTLMGWAYDSPQLHLRSLYGKTALILAEKKPYPAGRANALVWLGKEKEDAGDYEAAAVFYQKARQIRDSLGLYEKAAGCFNNLGRLRKKQNRYDDAIAFYELGLAKLDSLRPTKVAVDLYNNLGTAYRYLGKTENAVYYFKKSQDFALRQKNKLGTAQARLNIGNLLQDHQGAYQAAFDSLQQCLADFIQMDKPEYVAKTQLALGNNAAYKGDLNAAIKYYTDCELLQRHMNIQDRTILRKNIGQAHVAKGDFKKAIEYLQSSLDTFVMLNNTAEATATRLEIGNCSYSQLSKENQDLRLYGWVLGLALFILSLLGFSIAKTQHQRRTIAENQLRISEQSAQLVAQENLALLQNKELEMTYARLEGQEMMQKQIGIELHDGVGAMLSTVKINLAPVDEALDRLPEINQTQYRQVNRLLDEACEEVRRISHELSSALLNKFGLKAQLEALADAVKGSGKLEVELVTHGLSERLESKVELNVYRIIQELVNNVIKHAQANYISLQVNRFGHKIAIILEDNGKGFDITTLGHKKGTGMHNLIARVHDLKGDIQIDSKLGRGTIVSIDIPQ